MRKHLSSISNFIFENQIPKDCIKYEDHKVFVDQQFQLPIILKKLETDSLGISSFYGKAFNPNYNFYVVNSYEEIQTDLEKIKKFSSKDVNSISDLKGKIIYVLQVELSGNVLEKKVRPHFENSAGGKIQLSLKGERSIYNDTALDESKKRDSYQNLIKQGDFALFLELSHEIISIERTYFGSFYEDGIYTFFYYAEAASAGEEEVSF